MLRQRVITALILAVALIAALLFAPYPAQAMLFAAVAAAGGWEWAALVGAQVAFSRAAYAAVIPLLCGALWISLALDGPEAAMHARPWLAAAALLWSAMLVGLKYYSAGRGVWGYVWVRAVMGWLMLTATWLAVTVCLTLINGPFVVFLLILTVAAADIGAYFAGRRFGQHALAAEISPAKTWEGFWGGMLCVALLACLLYTSPSPRDKRQSRMPSSA